MLTKLKQRKNNNYLREKINYNICICFSAFYKTKLFSWILTLVNFASERNKTLFSGGTRREAWERPTPLFSDPPKGPRDKQTLLLLPPPLPHLISRSGWSGPPTISSSFVFSGSRSYILYPVYYIRNSALITLPKTVLTDTGWNCHQVFGNVLAQHYYHKLE